MPLVSAAFSFASLTPPTRRCASSSAHPDCCSAPTANAVRAMSSQPVGFVRTVSSPARTRSSTATVASRSTANPSLK